MKLKKPPAYNYDFAIVGFSMVLTGILGFPFTHGLIPQAPLHVISLAQMVHKTRTVNGVSHTIPVVESVIETRLSNLLMSILIGLTACIPALLNLLSQIPISVLAGLFLFMGFGAFEGNLFVSRILLLFSQPVSRKLYFENVDLLAYSTTVKYTLVQIGCLVIIFGITLTPAAISFPILIGLLVPLREFVLSRYFDKKDLDCLDGYAIESEEIPSSDAETAESSSLDNLGFNAVAIIEFPPNKPNETIE